MLLCYGFLSGTAAGSDWMPSQAQIPAEHSLKLTAGWPAIRERASQLDGRLLALATQYGWQLLGLMLAGAALVRNGWLTGQRSCQHHRRCGWGLLIVGLLITLPGTRLQWLTGWGYRWCGFFLQLQAVLGAPLISLGDIARLFAGWPVNAGQPAWALADAGRKDGVKSLPVADADLHADFFGGRRLYALPALAAYWHSAGHLNH